VASRVKYSAAGKSGKFFSMLAETLSLSVEEYFNEEIKLPTGKHLKNEHPLRTDVDASLVIN